MAGDSYMTDFTDMLGRQVAGRYTLLKLLGSGGFGGVFAARDTVLERAVAIKILAKGLMGSSHPQRFQREARLLARLRHPNIVQVLDFGEDLGTHFLVMELIEGESLGQLLQNSFPLPLLRIVNICDQILQALSEAHSHGVLHRDLKPDNILVIRRRDLSDLVKMVDFGTATLIEPGDVFRTSDGHFYGTPAYMSPEQCRDAVLDARSDLYAFGCLLYQLLCASPPFLAPGPIETLMAHALQEPIPPSVRYKKGTVSPGLEKIALSCLAKQPEDRPASAEAVRLELHRVGGDGFSPPRLAPVLPLKRADGTDALQRSAANSAANTETSKAAEPLSARVCVVAPRAKRLEDVVACLTLLKATVTVQPTLPEAVGRGADVVILDMLDPSLTQWCEILKAESRPFLLCGDEADVEAMARAVELGAHDFVPLPVHQGALRRCVARAARVRRT